MLLVDSYAQAYRWPLDHILRLTMPQIIMINHAAHVNKKRLDRRIERNRERGDQPLEDRIAEMPMWNGKRIDELTSEEYLEYHRSALNF